MFCSAVLAAAGLDSLIANGRQNSIVVLFRPNSGQIKVPSRTAEKEAKPAEHKFWRPISFRYYYYLSIFN